MTNEELGERIGVGHSMASRIRNGQRLPSTKVLGRIHSELDIPWEDLMRAHAGGSERFGRLIQERLRARAARSSEAGSGVAA